MDFQPPEDQWTKTETERRLLVRIGERVSQAFRHLLERKHIYQSVRVEFSMDDVLRVTPRWDEQDRVSLFSGVSFALYGLGWEQSQPGGAVGGKQPNRKTHLLRFEVPSIKTFCRTCERVEPFDPAQVHEFPQKAQPPSLEELSKLLQSAREESGSKFSALPPFLQDFGMVYACQACKAREGTEVFLVRREGEKLTLCGRAPMALIEIPSYVPKREQGFYRDAIIAHQAGQPLPALFMLRTFIEQFARRETGIADTNVRGEELFKVYMEKLPESFKGSFPSLLEWYAKLSAALHAANPDLCPFEEAMAAINHHFDGRRVHRLDARTEAPPTPPP